MISMKTFRLVSLLACACASQWAFAFTVDVSSQAELNAAIVDFNDEVSGIHTINLIDNITLASALTAINNGSSSPRLVVSGFDILNTSKVLDGASSHRILTISGNSNVRIENLFLKNGRATSGGAILLSAGATLGVVSSQFESNSATAGDGGAIRNDGGDLRIFTSTFKSNSSVGGQGGGAIKSTDGFLSVEFSTFVDNSAGSSATRGGGIFIRGNSGTTSYIARSTFYNNSASFGGGISADGSSPGYVKVALSNNVFADNASNDCVVDGSDQVIDQGNNVIKSTGFGACDLVDNTNSNQIGSDPLLVGLGFFGGPTETVPLSISSPAIDAGTLNFIDAIDQRGVSRRLDAPDVGAFEYLKADVLEPNNDLLSAYELTANESFTELNIGDHEVHSQDVDYFRLPLRSQQQVNIEVLFNHDAGDLDAYLLDASQVQIASSDSTTDNEFITFTAPADGDYFLRIAGYSNARNHYDLAIETLEVEDLCIVLKSKSSNVISFCL
ncbi:PPC domain-containing protein [Arenicella xantha]|uniref:Pre-peptidase n=1 Tax=Arenicella xantha TaxID=644221 RepID=A0A395JII3_9GAMM|nr:PPC domain-containing protein [Arenicella xantha]RBP48565.1 pre-peptidase [Arenicella xantha]